MSASVCHFPAYNQKEVSIHPRFLFLDQQNNHTHARTHTPQLANYALRLLAGAKDVQGVEMLLERMRTGGVGRDVVSWTTAIKVTI